MPTPKPTPESTPTPTEKSTPTPTEKPTPEPTPFRGSSSDIIYDAICNQGLGWSCQQALNIAWCETRWQPWEYNSSGATGLFQVMLPLWAEMLDGDPLDPYVNARAAYRVYSIRGNWSAWACYPYE